MTIKYILNSSDPIIASTRLNAAEYKATFVPNSFKITTNVVKHGKYKVTKTIKTMTWSIVIGKCSIESTPNACVAITRTNSFRKKPNRRVEPNSVGSPNT